MRKKITTVFVAGLSGILLLAPSVALARSNVTEVTPRSIPTTVNPELQVARESAEVFRRKQKDIRREVRTDRRCEQVKDNISNRITRYQNNFDRRLARYTAMTDKLSSAIERLNELAIDTSELQRVLNELNLLILEFETNFNTMLSTLDSALGMSCDDTLANDYAIMVDRVKANLKLLRESTASIHSLIADQLKTAMQNIRTVISESDSPTE